MGMNQEFKGHTHSECIWFDLKTKSCKGDISPMPCNPSEEACECFIDRQELERECEQE